LSIAKVKKLLKRLTENNELKVKTEVF